MPPVKGHDPSHSLASRIRLIRKRLGWPRKPLAQAELHAALRGKFGELAPSLSTVKRWEQKAYGRISPDDAVMVSDLARVDVGWVLTGKGREPGTKNAARAQQRLVDVGDTGTGGGYPRAASSDAPGHQRSQAGLLLRALTAQHDHLRRRVEEGGTDGAAFNALIAQTAGQMLADRIAVLFKQTFEDNEIADTKAGRQFTVAFLDRIVEDFGAMGLNVTDLARYANELRRHQERH